VGGGGLNLQGKEGNLIIRYEMGRSSESLKSAGKPKPRLLKPSGGELKSPGGNISIVKGS